MKPTPLNDLPRKWREDACGFMHEDIAEIYTDFADELERALAEHQAALANQWQPIETAPKDGDEIIAFHPNFCTQFFVRWVQPEGQKGCWYEDFANKSMSGFTHWMPLPTPPAQ